MRTKPLLTAQPVMRPEPSLDSDGRIKRDWNAPDTVWRPQERFVVSRWGAPGDSFGNVGSLWRNKP